VARLDLNAQNRLWWHQAPASGEVDLNIPVEPPELIAKYSARLIDHISRMDPVVLDNMAHCRESDIAKTSRQKIQGTGDRS
jgi:hypothetical protein